MVAAASSAYRAAMTPPRPIMELAWAFHRALHRSLGARVSTSPPSAAGKVGTLFLATTGRKSGKARKTGLFYVENGESFVVVASNAGADVDPAWWLNLQANPEAVVEVGSRQVPVRARQATPVEADSLWPRLDAGYPEYARYRERRARPIPIVILEPSSGNRSPSRVESR
jgi:deazaflavin-dependent oxidoreductase (nitroreductase family)